MLTDLKVKVGPQCYLYHENAIDYVPKVLEEYKAKRILIVHGTISWQKAKPKLKFLDKVHYSFHYHLYSGECSYEEANKIASLVEEHDLDFIIGVGGGKLTDLVGYSAHLASVPFGVIPTLASNCAPWTPLAVMYKESGEAEGKSEHFLRQAAFFITDPSLIIDAPLDYFVAGLADTIAKWYESELILEQEDLREEPFLKLAGYTAKLCKEEILQYADKAIQDMKRQEVSAEFTRLSEIIFAVAGLVGGFGDKYARNAAAHAMHDAISKYIPASHHYLHGEKVAYGIFYQLALENRWDIIDELLPFYQLLHLPMSLKQMGIFPEDEVVLEKIVSFVDSKEKVHLIPIPITEDSLLNAIYQLESYINKD